MPGQRGGGKEVFAMIPSSMIKQATDAQCLRIYAFLDLRQGNKGRPVRGVQVIADELGLQPRTVTIHLEHLVDAGWVHIHRGSGSSNKKLVVEVVQNPARGRFAEGVNQLPERSRRHHHESRIRSHLEATATSPIESVAEASRAESISATENAKNAPSAARSSRATDATCSANLAPRPLSKRSGGYSRDEPGHATACSLCRVEPVAWWARLVDGHEIQVCDDDLTKLEEEAQLASSHAVDPDDPSTFPRHNF